MCATLFLLMAMVGMAFDFGRVYVAHNEAQLYTDSAALTAATKLNATEAGLAEARAAVAKVPGRRNFGNQPITGAKVEFSADGKRWVAGPTREVPAEQLTMVRVSAPSSNVDMTFLRVAGSPSFMQVDAASVAAIAPVRLVQ
jgi:Flp pilus assembly protein TadG